MPLVSMSFRFHSSGATPWLHLPFLTLSLLKNTASPFQKWNGHTWAWYFLVIRSCHDPHPDSGSAVRFSQHHLPPGTHCLPSLSGDSRLIPWCSQISLLCGHYVFSLSNPEQSMKRHFKTMQVSCMSSHPLPFSVYQSVAMVTEGWFPSSLSPSLCLPFIHPFICLLVSAIYLYYQHRHTDI